MNSPEILREFNHNIPNEISSEVKLTRSVTLKALAIALAIWMVLLSFSNLVHPGLNLPYAVYAFFVAGIIVLPSSKTPQKQFYQTLMLTFTKDSRVYHPVKEWESSDNEENE